MSMSLALQEYIDDVLLARKLQKETIFTLDEVKVDAIIAKMLGRTPPRTNTFRINFPDSSRAVTLQELIGTLQTGPPTFLTRVCGR